VPIFTQFNTLMFYVGSINMHTHKLKLNVNLPNIGIQYIVSKTCIAESCAMLNPSMCILLLKSLKVGCNQHQGCANYGLFFFVELCRVYTPL